MENGANISGMADNDLRPIANASSALLKSAVAMPSGKISIRRSRSVSVSQLRFPYFVESINSSTDQRL